MTHRAAAAWALALAILTFPASGFANFIAGPGSGPGQVNAPSSLSLNAAGELVVGDTGNARIQKLSTTGQHLLSFDVPYSSSSSTLLSAVGEGDHIYTSFGYGSGKISKYTTTGSLVKTWGDSFGGPESLSDVRGVAAGGSGEVFVLASDQSAPGSTYRVVRHSADGTYLGAWQLRDADGLPRAPRAIAARGSVVAVVLDASESAPAELVRYDTTGAVLSRTPGTLDAYGHRGSLAYVVALTIAPSGEIFAAGDALIHQFSPTGKFVSQFNADMSPPTVYTNPAYCEPVHDTSQGSVPPFAFSAVAVDGAGDVFAADTRYHSVIRFDGTPIPVLDWGPRPPIYLGYTPEDFMTPTTGQTISFDAGRSRVPFGTVTKFEWDFDGDGIFERETGTNSRAETAYATRGWRDVGIRITGSRGKSAVATERFFVGESKVSVGGNPFGVTGKQVRFQANVPPFCTSGQYEWDLDGDGTFETSTGSNPEVRTVYDSPGTTIVRLRATRGGVRVDEAEFHHETYLAPPSGPVGVTINNGAAFTNTPDVTVNTIWPKFTQRLLVANDGGFRNARTFTLRQDQPWRLDSSGPERLPKTVYVRFKNNMVSSADQTFTDDIILDETNPVIVQVDLLDGGSGTAARASKRRTVGVLVRARDNLSGVSRVQITANRKRPGKWRRMRRISRVKTGADRLWVRVRDKAGNKSRWRVAR